MLGKLCAISVAVSIFIKPGIKIGKGGREEGREGGKGWCYWRIFVFVFNGKLQTISPTVGESI